MGAPNANLHLIRSSAKGRPNIQIIFFFGKIDYLILVIFSFTTVLGQLNGLSNAKTVGQKQ
jgi:hypothetical protein